MSQYVPSREAIERLLAEREEQGLPAEPSEESLAFTAAILRDHLEEKARAQESGQPEEGAA